MERKEFLGKICGGLTFTCVATMMAACSKDDATSGTTPGNVTPTPGGGTNNALLTVNLLSQMVSVNDFVAEKGVIVVRTATGNSASSFTAFSSVCPHAGSTVTYISNNKTFNCSAHGSNFSSTGSVTQGPASSGLTKLTVEVTGSTLTVKA
jgi:cytochrome b6-f complex iron-sulfur subunit